MAKSYYVKSQILVNPLLNLIVCQISDWSEKPQILPINLVSKNLNVNALRIINIQCGNDANWKKITLTYLRGNGQLSKSAEAMKNLGKHRLRYIDYEYSRVNVELGHFEFMGNG